MLLPLYSWWHGSIKFKGAGFLIKRIAVISKSLQNCPIRLPEGQTILLDFRDVSAMSWFNHLIGDQVQEAGLIKAMNSVIHRNTVVWDVGANCGLVSYLLAKTTAAGNIFAFEPNQQMYSLCCSALAPFSRVKCFNYALSDRRGRLDMVVPHGSSTLGTLEPRSITDGGLRLQVKCELGDELVESGEVLPPGVIKIDTEGHERSVLLGLQGVIRSYKPLIFFEHIALTDFDIERLVPQGYRLFSISSEEGCLTASLDRSKGHNSALIPQAT